jgi:hypothetical protein
MQVTMEGDASVVGEDVVVLPHEQGENLMFQRILLKPEQKLIEEPEQRKRVFKTRCKVEGKCCNLIIDGGSTKNLISTEVKRKLNLKCEPHPNPYRVSWLQKGQQVTVTEQCLLKFHIGDFKEKVLCDVVEMDACHILLGRPWMFDRKVFHDGRENSYEFTQNGQCYKLTPMREDGGSNNNSCNKDVNSSNNCIMLCSSKEFLKEKKQNGYCLVVVPKKVQEDEKGSSVPAEIQCMLEYFKEIVAEELPTGLPPLRSISHQIDLIPGLNFPNKAPYRMTPSESEEVNRQVQELLDRGLIRESLSPCSTNSIDA